MEGLKQTKKVAKVGQPMPAERKAAEEESLEAVKATMLISGANCKK